MKQRPYLQGWWVRLPVLMLGVCLTLIDLNSAWSVPPDVADHSLRVMCERGLAQSAAEYCRAQTNLFIENPTPRARWAMRHLECLSQIALRSTSPDTSSDWQAVEQTESDYRREFPDDPRLPWLAWQVARAELLRSQQALARWMATPASTAQRELALQSVRKLGVLLDALDKDLKQRMPLAQSRGPNNSQAPNRELHELQLDGELLRCESFLVRAKCYANDSPDHLAALAEVDRTVNDVMKLAATDWPSRDQLLVAQATAGLEVGKRKESLDLLIRTLLGQADEGHQDSSTGINVGQPSELARLRAGCALVEALCAEGKPDQAAEFAKVLTKITQGPEVDLAALRVAIARMKQQSGNQRAEALASVIAETKSLGERYGSYWRNRGEALLVTEASSTGTTATSVAKDSSATTSSTNATPTAGMSELLTIEIRQLLAGGQTMAAIAKLRTASTTAQSSERAEEAVLYALEAARLMQKEKQWLEAADLLAPVAVQFPDAKEAAAAHALAAWCVAQSLKDSSPQAVEKQYEELLVEQLTKWPDASETIKGEEYLARG